MHKCTETQQKPHPQAVQNNKKLQKPNKKNQKNHSCTKRAEKPHFTSATDYKTKSTNPTSADCQNTYYNPQQEYYKKAQKQYTTQ